LGLSPGSRALEPASEPAAAVLAAAVLAAAVLAAAVLAAAVAQLRQSAGVYDYLAKQVLPALFLTVKGDRWVCLRVPRLLSCSWATCDAGKPPRTEAE
jgi:hypothetical protein